MIKRLKTWLPALILLASLTGCVSTKTGKSNLPNSLVLGAPFCDNMVLQRDMEVPIWGWNKPGRTITVKFGGQIKTATADKAGNWTVGLSSLKASFKPAEMAISDSAGKKVTIKNILVGEVWLASGQSNMHWTVTKSKCLALATKLSEETKGKVAPIREFEVTSVTSQLHPIKKATGEWKDGNYTDYSAIAFAFADKLYKELKVPIGILKCSFSQTAIQAWVPREGWATAKDEYSKAINQKCLITDPTTPEHKKAWDAFYKSLEDQIAVSEKAIKKGENAKAITAEVPGNLHGNRDATWLFNGSLSPVVPYAIRGAIWNQGYANMGEGLSYYNNLHSLIRGWRIVWNRPDLPVYFHQFYCPKNGNPTGRPAIGGTGEMRLGTWMARDIPNTGMASQIDIGGAIHYQAKAVPGQRLALHALKNQYPSTKLRAGGLAKNLVADGPMFKSYRVDGDKMIVNFDHAEGGLVVAETHSNYSYRPPRPDRKTGKIPKVDPSKVGTGFADPKIIPNGDDQVKCFWIAGADKVWHPASMKISGDNVIVTSPAVKKPHGISYGSDGIGMIPCLYNKALLPMTPFIQYDHKMVLAKTWPDEKLKIAGETIDPNTIGKIYEYRKMPLLSVQFRDNAVFQAEQPVTIWGSTRKYGDWQYEDEKGDCKVYFEFGPESGPATIKKVIDVTPGLAEWKVTLPPMKAGPKPYTLKVHFTIDGEKVHERIIPGIVFGDVWCVVVPALAKKEKWKIPKVKPSGQIVRMIANQSNRDGRATPSRFSICTSRTPKNRLAARWKDAEGMAAAIGNTIAAKKKRPVGIIFLQAKKDIPIKNWIAPSFLKDAPSLMEDYKTVGSQYFDNPYYLANVRRYIGDWKHYWNEYIPEMMETKSVPDGGSWGHYPSPKPNVGDSTATFEYNVYMYCFTPASLSGIIFLTGKSMVADGGANFAPEMAVLANSFKTRFGIKPGPTGDWQNSDSDTPFIYTLPSKELAPKISTPAIKGKNTPIEINDWSEVGKVIDATVK